MSENYRKYSISDAELFQFGETVISFLPKDLNDFSDFDSTIGAHTVDGLKQSRAAIDEVKTDDVLIDELAQLTDEVNATMAACNTAYKTTGFFVRKAFKDKPAVQNQFGHNDIKKARHSHAEMIVFMKSLAEMAAKFENELVAAGCNQAVIKSLPGLQQNLAEANNKQEMFKKERGAITQERVQRINNFYEQLLPICAIARIIYADNPAQLAKYTMPTPPSSTNNSDEDLLVNI